ncbi:hypothetical protein MNBD_GAMMA22-2708 [hydrothermal vent metagenome]|uniref:Uncharacterized protein n=1 Tax=hydrothermal vent metagenome TaxID=652676 RepID=A0A3B0ZTL3_9ZZZZ
MKNNISKMIVTTGVFVTVAISSVSVFAMGSHGGIGQMPQATMNMTQTEVRMKQNGTKINETAMSEMSASETTKIHEHSNAETQLEHEIASNYEEDHIYYKDMNLDINEPDYVN